MAIYNSKRHRNLEADHVFLGIGQWKHKIRLIYLRMFLIFINLAVLMCAMLCFSAGRHARIIKENNFEEVEKSREDFLSKAYHHEQEDMKAQELGLAAIHHDEDEKDVNNPHEHSEDKDVSTSQDVEEHSHHKEKDSHQNNVDDNEVNISNHAHAHVEEKEEATSRKEHSHKTKENGHQSREDEDTVNISNHDSAHAEEVREATSQKDKEKNSHHGSHGDKDQEMIQEMVSAVNIHIENILYLISTLLFFCWIVFGAFISYDFGGQSEVSVLLLVLGMPYTVAMVLWEVGLAFLFHKMVVWAPLAKHHPMMAFYSDWMVVPTFLKLSGVAQIVTAYLPFVVYYLPSDYLHEMPEHIDGFQRASISAGQLVLDAMRTDHQIHTSEKPLCDMFLGKYYPHPRLQAADTLAGGVTIFNDLGKQTKDMILFKNIQEQFVLTVFVEMSFSPSISR